MMINSQLISTISPCYQDISFKSQICILHFTKELTNSITQLSQGPIEKNYIQLPYSSLV